MLQNDAAAAVPRNEIRTCGFRTGIVMHVTQDEVPQPAGEPIGTGWRVAAWMAFGVAVAIAWLVMTTKPNDFVHAAVLAGGTLFTLFLCALGLVFSLFGAAA